MTIRDEIYDRLAATTGVSSLVGTRIYREILPQNATLPAITYSRLSGTRLHSLAAATGQAMPTFTVSCWAANAGGAEDVAEAVRGALDDWRDSTAGIQDARIIGEIDLYDDGLDAYRMVVDFAIMHDE